MVNLPGLETAFNPKRIAAPALKPTIQLGFGSHPNLKGLPVLTDDQFQITTCSPELVCCDKEACETSTEVAPASTHCADSSAACYDEALCEKDDRIEDSVCCDPSLECCDTEACDSENSIEPELRTDETSERSKNPVFRIVQWLASLAFSLLQELKNFLTPGDETPHKNTRHTGQLLD